MAERDRAFKVVLYDADYLLAVNILKNLYLGPGEPGPGDEWKMPARPIDDVATEPDEPAASARPERKGWLRRIPRRG